MIKDRLKKGVNLLPTLLTMGNILCGVFAIVASFNRDWYQACLAIAVAFALDGLDGRIARMVDSQSEFGLQLDALADLVSFGMAPAMIAYTNWMFFYERLGILLAFMFVCGAALRLARFNAHDVESDLKGFFNGFPTPAAAGVIVSLYFVEYKFFIVNQYFSERFQQGFAVAVPLLVLVLSYLMLSNLKYPNFKQAADFEGHPFGVITALLLFIFLAALFPLMVFSVGFLGYLLLGILNFVPALQWGTNNKEAKAES
jgi:CDP-diacylglycerol--serine O-phosphatidyltransferase